MKIREHTALPNGRCQWCGAAPVNGIGSGYGEKTCLEREDHIGRLMPEPRRRQFAHLDAETINARLAELAAERHACEVRRGCAAAEGRDKAQCDCEGRCRACNVYQGYPAPGCALCWASDTPTRPCP